MSYLFSHIDLSRTEHGFISKAGQELVFEAANEYIGRVNADMMGAISAFVSTVTETFQEKYKLPGGGYLQRRGTNGSFRNVGANGSWTVAYPIEDFGAAFEATDVALGYMTGEELSNHIQTVVTQNANTVRHEILKRLLNNTVSTFTDPHHGALSVQPLANGDAVLYPPAIGADAEATADHYLEAGYTAISNTNDPFITIADKLEGYFGTPSGGSNIVAFISNAQTSEVRDLASFVSVADMGINYGNDTSLSMIPSQIASMSSSRILGRHEEAGVWIAEWRYLPSAYMVGTHLDVEAPLKMRVDPSSTGLGRGLQLVANESQFPTERMIWRNRFGVGAANRLNGVVMEIANGGSYTVPSAYA